MNHPKTYVDSGYAFNLGYSFPTALGAKVARPDRPVVCVVGDGGFMFNAAELSTAVKYGIDVVTVVFRNDSYGNVARDLDEFFGGTYETDLVNPDLVAFAESFGAVGLRAEDPMDLERLLPEALERRVPVVIDVPVGHVALPPCQAPGARALPAVDAPPGRTHLLLRGGVRSPAAERGGPETVSGPPSHRPG